MQIETIPVGRIINLIRCSCVRIIKALLLQFYPAALSKFFSIVRFPMSLKIEHSDNIFKRIKASAAVLSVRTIEAYSEYIDSTDFFQYHFLRFNAPYSKKAQMM